MVRVYLQAALTRCCTAYKYKKRSLAIAFLHIYRKAIVYDDSMTRTSSCFSLPNKVVTANHFWLADCCWVVVARLFGWLVDCCWAATCLFRWLAICWLWLNWKQKHPFYWKIKIISINTYVGKGDSEFDIFHVSFLGYPLHFKAWNFLFSNFHKLKNQSRY